MFGPPTLQVSPLRRWASTNIDATAFASKIPTITRPVASATAAVLDLTNATAGGTAPTWMRLLFILLGADNDVASFRIIGWSRCTKDDETNPLYVPIPVAEFSCTASAAVGIASEAVINTERFCDTIAPVALMIPDIKIAAGTSLSSDTRVRTPANDTIGFVIMPMPAFELLEFTLDQTTNNPPGNILYQFLR